MPELPEVETLRRDLLACVPGQQVIDVEILRADSVEAPRPAAVFVEQMRSQVFTDRIDRRGKYLLLHLASGASLGVHLRMSGRLLWRSAESPDESHLRVRLRMIDGHELRFEDMRVFGRLWLVPVGVNPDRVMTGLRRLGPEPFSPDFDASYLARRFTGRSQPVKSALLDQSLVAGVGNIYADEALFQAGIDPQTPVQSLAPDQLARLWAAVIAVLEAGIASRGSSLRNYTDTQGINGNYTAAAQVYGRRGESCRICGTPVARIRLAGRSTHFCPTCQTRP